MGKTKNDFNMTNLNSMKISSKRLLQFTNLFKAKTGVILMEQEALIRAETLLRTISILYLPISIPDYSLVLAKKMFIKNISADMGTVMKRYFPRARGSAFVIRRKLSHVNLVLEERGKAKAGGVKLGFLQKADKEKKAEASVDQKDATNEKPTSETPKKQQLFKSEEQVKMNKVQNKRRLFNRKSGE